MKLLKFPNFNIHFLSLQTLQLLDFNLFLRCFLDDSRFLMEPAGILCFTFGASRRSFILLSWEFKMLLKCFEKFSFYKAESFGCSFFKEYLQSFCSICKIWEQRAMISSKSSPYSRNPFDQSFEECGAYHNYCV